MEELHAVTPIAYRFLAALRSGEKPAREAFMAELSSDEERQIFATLIDDVEDENSGFKENEKLVADR